MSTRLEQLSAMSKDELIAALAQAENKTRKANTLSLKVAEKGGLSVYGVGRFPVTLYAESWVKVLAIAPAILEFIKANQNAGLSFKNGIPELGISSPAEDAARYGSPAPVAEAK